MATSVKSAFKSKTMWANVGVAAITVGVETLGGGLAAQGVEPSWLLGFMAVLNMGLRLLTTGAVSISGKF